MSARNGCVVGMIGTAVIVAGVVLWLFVSAVASALYRADTETLALLVALELFAIPLAFALGLLIGNWKLRMFRSGFDEGMGHAELMMPRVLTMAREWFGREDRRKTEVWYDNRHPDPLLPPPVLTIAEEEETAADETRRIRL